MAMFPDSGVPPSDAKNSLSDVDTNNCDELWYSTSRCTPRFDPAAANAMLAEDMNLIMRGGVTYQCDDLDNIERAVRYIVQRGLARSMLMKGGPFDYVGVLDPGMTHYNNFLTLTVVPEVTNQAAVRVNIDDKGYVYILRNDGAHMRSGDMRGGIPYIIAFINGNFYLCGLAASQVPILSPALDFWIRTDGNDATGDGTANTADKAFRTLNGCWAAVGGRYAATPSFAINMRLGIPGTYAGGFIGPFGGNVSITGDMSNPNAYRIDTAWNGAANWQALWINGVNVMVLRGITCVMSHGAPDFCIGIAATGGTRLVTQNIKVEVVVPNAAAGTMIQTEGFSSWTTANGNTWLAGNGYQVASIFTAILTGDMYGARLAAGEASHFWFENIACSQQAMTCVSLSTMHWGPATFHISNVTGKQYNVTENSILAMGGQPLLGTVAGTASSGGQFSA